MLDLQTQPLNQPHDFVRFNMEIKQGRLAGLQCWALMPGRCIPRAFCLILTGSALLFSDHTQRWPFLADREGFCFVLQKQCSPLLLHFPEAQPCSLPTVCLTLAEPRCCMLLHIRFQMQAQVVASCQAKSFSPQRPACRPYELQLCTAKKGTALTVGASFLPLLRDVPFCNTTWCTANICIAMWHLNEPAMWNALNTTSHSPIHLSRGLFWGCKQ